MGCVFCDNELPVLLALRKFTHIASALPEPPKSQIEQSIANRAIKSQIVQTDRKYRTIAYRAQSQEEQINHKPSAMNATPLLQYQPFLPPSLPTPATQVWGGKGEEMVHRRSIAERVDPRGTTHTESLLRSAAKH
jgi:hypothetical protein